MTERKQRRGRIQRKRMLRRKILKTAGISLTAIAAFAAAVVLGSEPGVIRDSAKRTQAQPSPQKETAPAKAQKQAECILQMPELPTGCEATAGAILLNAYGYDADKTEVADCMAKDTFTEIGGVRYASYPDEAFIGDPYTEYGYGAFPGVLAEAMQEIIDSRGGEHRAVPLYNLREEELLEYIDAGAFLCVWTSNGGTEIERRSGWYLIRDGKYTENFFYWPSNEHVVVLTAYDSGSVTVCDPLYGDQTVSREEFFRHYDQVGRYAAALEA